LTFRLLLVTKEMPLSSATVLDSFGRRAMKTRAA
jgi:hypothetical protein